MSTKPQGTQSDLIRISKSKTAVDVCPNTIRKMAEQGLRIYSLGRAKFFSKTEFENFIRMKGK